MEFTLNGKSLLFLDGNDWPGVHRVAGKVSGDMELVFGTSEKPEIKNGAFTDADITDGGIYAGCIGKSEVVECFEKSGLIDLSCVKGKREVFLFAPLDVNGKKVIVIAGSDKRGTIYGLFHISELMGVSPWVWFADVKPARKNEIIVTENDTFVSKEPSVRYRGFFINDEWPSYGTWTNNLFGGFNAKMYDHVFEVLLRMHGNYLWPAMWSSCFSEDGPGTESAALADEYGVVMGTSHHEPCMRHGEEFSHVKGPDSKYGNDWNFNRNREGLIEFWRDGLKRNAPFENIVTVGMRGEADSEMLGRECTVLDNINYLKDVITTQRGLLREVYGDREPEIAKVFAVYKEVETFYYGDAENEGLRTWDGLDGTIILLSDDNHGNMRLLPPAGDRDHNGGFGMYYHLDYHGGPVSYEWVNSTYIPRIAEQMGQAWECGVRDLWIVNVGDIKPVEYPLNYFMDLAYDYDKWSAEYAFYPGYWADKQFSAEGPDTVSKIADILDDYSRINSVRRPETIAPDTFSPVYRSEADSMLSAAHRVSSAAEAMLDRFNGKENRDAFYQLVYYPAAASMNVLTMMLYSGKNMLLARRGCPSANLYADGIEKCLELDAKLASEYNALGNGKWNGMMLSEHIGFTNWNEEEHMIPVRVYVKPYERDRVCVSVSGYPAFTMGGDWTKKDLVMTDLLIPGSDGEIVLENCCKDSCEWEITSDSDWIVLSAVKGSMNVAPDEDAVCTECSEKAISRIKVSADRELLHKACTDAGSDHITGTVTVISGRCKAFVKAVARDFTEEEISAAHFVPVLPADAPRPFGGADLSCAIEVDEYDTISGGKDCDFKVYKPYGKFSSGMRVFPTDGGSGDPKDMPSVQYSMYLPEDGEYEITLSQAPGGPVLKETFSSLAVAVNDGDVIRVKGVAEDYRAGENGCREWCNVVLVHEKKASFVAAGRKGNNTIRIFGCEPGAVLMRITVRRMQEDAPYSFFGPTPTFISEQR